MKAERTDPREIVGWARAAIVPSILGMLLAALAILTATQVVAGQDRPVDSGWLPWAGCWETVGQLGGPPAASDDSRDPRAPGRFDPPGDTAVADGPEDFRTVTCVRATGGELAAEILTVEPGEEPGDPEVLRADGEERATSRQGCEGSERADFSRDGARVYLESEYTCRGGVQRISTGLFTLVSPWEWLDVRSVESGGEARTWTRRYYRLRPDEVDRPELEAWADVEEELAVETARIALSGAPSLDDVIEASSRLHEDAVIAWLAEEGDPIRVDGSDLVELARAGVPGGVTDMLVALSNPDHFLVGTGGEVEVQDPHQGRSGYAYRPPRRVVSGTGVWGGWGPYRSGFGLWGYRYDPFYHPWGYAGYGYGYTYRPAFIYVQPRSPQDTGGRTAVPRPSRSSSRGSPEARAPSRGSDGGSVSSSGGSRGGSSSGSTGRTAVPRGDRDGGN